ncbi:metallophosphoesterase [Mucilaginibacter sp. FT3.2]|uniref:metallophosphoesterase n=1 Tax=Mucilaginibacter sp. FT3.2 TaxID=2723090 RepID=UPI00160E1B48|nr:metallophosphoesterase [Mucilaginibacter sp. FT3.2]MBB6232428.1 putative MPP superfamily phosphohydrolase [Mucilaginibacter sp. FT3.2]
MGLKLLHISDIHFRSFRNNSYLDLDKDIQNELEFDLRELKADFGKIDLILIGGDIAFSGSEEEYKVADDWIKKICEITECDQENVLTVPGNHDVDRSKLSAILMDAHQQLKQLKSRNDIDKKIGQYVVDKESAKTLLSPLTNYNNFAQKYGSIPQGDNILYWTKDVLLDNSILRIRGVNSALVSDSGDDESTSKLLLGSHQSNITRDIGVVNLVLCHHPPQWLIDGDEVQNDFNARTRIQLFGHKHSFGREVINNCCLVLAAGAMQPSRNEQGWEPRYNIIELSIPSVMQDHLLNVKLFKRVWKKGKKKFVADDVDGNGNFEEHNLQLDKHEIPENIIAKHEVIKELKIAPMAEPVINTNSPDPKRRLAFLFLGLPYHLKLKIAFDLGLIDDMDKDLNEIEKTQAYFKRASERSLLKELWEQVAQIINLKTTNPFIK